MKYQQTLDYIYSQLPMYQRIGKAAYKADLNNTLALDKHFGHPHTHFKTIHIGGTNGKGSTSHMIASILMKAGFKVGLYTSPHLMDYRERVRVNGKMISKSYVIDFVRSNKKFFETLKPSFFEMTVAMAFCYFSHKKVDTAVIEVGLGGRLDSTNIISPVASIITNIGLDHTDLLGNTLEQIAIEKAGIIKPNTPVIICEWQKKVSRIFESKAKEMNAPLVYADKIYTCTSNEVLKNNYQSFCILNMQEVKYKSLSLDLVGYYQSKNLIGVLATIDELTKKGYYIDAHHIIEGLANVSGDTGLLGRWQILGTSPTIICDTGHNVEGLSYIVKQINQMTFGDLHMIIGMVSDKNIDAMLNILPKNAAYYFTKASIPRAINEKDLAAKAARFSLYGTQHPTVKKAIDVAINNAKANDLIFIGGSTFVVADALSYINP